MKRLFAKVNVLGQEYKIYLSDSKSDEYLSDKDAYTHYTKKYITIDGTIKDQQFREHLIRHELVHAFLNESGLHTQCQWAANEETVDWIAYQLLNMNKTCKDAIGQLKGYYKKVLAQIDAKAKEEAK